MKVYLVTQGVYEEDYQVLATFLDKEKAEHYVAELSDNGMKYADPYEIEEMDALDDSIDISESKVYKAVHFSYLCHRDRLTIGSIVYSKKPIQKEVNMRIVKYLSENSSRVCHGHIPFEGDLSRDELKDLVRHELKKMSIKVG